MDRFKQQRRKRQQEADKLLPADKRRCIVCEVVKGITDFRAKPSGERPKTCDACRPLATKRVLRYRHSHIDAQRKREREMSARIRNEVIDAYGGKCACCGESHREFLALDHIEGGGLKHRRDNGWTGSRQLYYWARRNGYPKTLRVLCDNCNMSRGRYGYCPHERDRNLHNVSPEIAAEVKDLFAMAPEATVH